MYTRIALRPLKVSHSDVGEGGVEVNFEKNTIFPEHPVVKCFVLASLRLALCSIQRYSEHLFRRHLYNCSVSARGRTRTCPAETRRPRRSPTSPARPSSRWLVHTHTQRTPCLPSVIYRTSHIPCSIGSKKSLQLIGQELWDTLY